MMAVMGEEEEEEGEQRWNSKRDFTEYLSTQSSDPAGYQLCTYAVQLVPVQIDRRQVFDQAHNFP